MQPAKKLNHFIIYLCLCSLAVFALPGVTRSLAASQDKIEIQALEAGKQYERQIGGGKSHSYSITLAADQYLHAVVQQRGIKLVVSLFEPVGKKLAQFDGSTSPSILENILLVAKTSGDYRLEVHSTGDDTVAGSYVLRINQLRKATPQDATRVRAEALFADGIRLFSQRTPAGYTSAISRFEEALSLFQAIDEKARAATSLNNIGVMHSRLGRKEKAVEYYKESLAIKKTLNNLTDLILALDNIALIYTDLGKPDEAVSYFTQELAVLRAMNDKTGEYNTLNNIGLVYSNQGEKQKALDYLNQALTIVRAIKDSGGESGLLNDIAMVYSHMGEKRKALDLYDQSLLLARATKDRKGEARILSNVSSVYSDLGERQKALDYLAQALQSSRDLGDRNAEAGMLTTIGEIYYDLGDGPKALDHWNKALEITRALRDLGGQAHVLHDIGALFYLQGDAQTALEYFNKALPLRRAQKDRVGEARTLNNIGRIYLDQDKQQDALDYFNEALSLAKATSDQIGEASTLNNIGLFYSDQNDQPKALDYFARALLLARGVENKVIEARALGGIARAERKRGNLDESRKQVETLLALVESQRHGVISQGLRSSYLASKREYYGFYIDLLMQMHMLDPSQGHDASALQASERFRARSLLELLIESNADIRKGVDPALLDRERSLQQSLNLKAAYIARLSKSNDAQRAAAKREIEDLLSQYEQVQAQIKATSHQYSALTQPQPLSLTEIQRQVLDADTLLLEYALGPERSYLWVVSQTSVKSYSLPRRAEIERAARRVYDLLTTRQAGQGLNPSQQAARLAELDTQYWQAASELSRMLLSPLTASGKAKRLLIVTEGLLQYVPFAALPFAALPSPQITQPARSNDTAGLAGKSVLNASSLLPLISQYEIVSLPSASTLAVLRREFAGRKQAARALAVLADPVFDKEDSRVDMNPQGAGIRGARQQPRTRSPAPEKIPGEVESPVRPSALDSLGQIPRLPFTRQEAIYASSFIPESDRKIALDFDASRATVMSGELSQYRIVHFATHGLLNSEQPELSGIVFSLVDKQGAPQNGFLRLNEIYNLNLPAELVILSACQTGLGKEIKGEGLVGLTRGFMYSGAARVLASLWRVDDKATAELMKHFYQAMLGKERLPAAAALRAAQLALWKQKRWQAPYYWAGFVLQGEWR